MQQFTSTLFHFSTNKAEQVLTLDSTVTAIVESSQFITSNARRKTFPSDSMRMRTVKFINSLLANIYYDYRMVDGEAGWQYLMVSSR